jgi:hypothetical protein
MEFYAHSIKARFDSLRESLGVKKVVDLHSFVSSKNLVAMIRI